MNASPITRKARLRRILDWRFLVTLIVILALGWMIYSERRRAEEADAASVRDRAELRAQVDAQKAASKALAEQIRQLGQQPVIEPPESGDAPRIVVIPGPRGLRGPSCIEELGYPRCRGDKGEASKVPGPPGSAGSDGTDGLAGPRGKSCIEELGIQECRGEPGKDGRDGVTPDLSGYATQAWVIDLIRALGCEASTGEAPGPPLILTCSITGKP